MNIYEAINQRKIYLNKLIYDKKCAIACAPEGILRANRNGTGFQYYIRANKQDINGKYIRKNKQSLAKALGQKAYDKKILDAAKRELDALEKLNEYYKKESVENIIETLPSGFQNIVTPIIKPPNEIINEWLSQSFTPLAFRDNAPFFYSQKGERMRSKSEVLISDILIKENIPYIYEKPLLLNGHYVVYPDFTFLNTKEYQEFYWEHFGMLDDREYRESNLAKVNQYIKNDIYPGDRLIITHETLKNPIDMDIVELNVRRIKQWTCP